MRQRFQYPLRPEIIHKLLLKRTALRRGDRCISFTERERGVPPCRNPGVSVALRQNARRNHRSYPGLSRSDAIVKVAETVRVKTVESTYFSIYVTGHKDEALCRQLAERLAAAGNTTVVCSGGFHVDGITGQQIKEVQQAVDEICRLLCEALQKEEI